MQNIFRYFRRSLLFQPVLPFHLFPRILFQIDFMLQFSHQRAHRMSTAEEIRIHKDTGVLLQNQESGEHLVQVSPADHQIAFRGENGRGFSQGFGQAEAILRNDGNSATDNHGHIVQHGRNAQTIPDAHGGIFCFCHHHGFVRGGNQCAFGRVGSAGDVANFFYLKIGKVRIRFRPEDPMVLLHQNPRGIPQRETDVRKFFSVFNYILFHCVECHKLCSCSFPLFLIRPFKAGGVRLAVSFFQRTIDVLVILEQLVVDGGVFRVWVVFPFDGHEFLRCRKGRNDAQTD